MTKISRDDVVHMASLSSIELDESEFASLETDLSNILEQIQTLGELDTSGVEPTYQVTDRENVFRDDHIDNGGVTGEMLVTLAPDHSDNQIKVPKVL